MFRIKMKHSSSLHQTYDPPDDWENGSWTVDCICGVNFDDGREMVDCDECGVWVHTHCSRFVKKAKSFACHKCKKNPTNNNNNHNEETEVAQSLLELPTTPMKLRCINMIPDKNINNNNNGCNISNQMSSSPSHDRSWVNREMEEMVHVHGVPGGDDDPGLFKGFPIPFASQLWKCSGYIPKKFSFTYKEFPCWDSEVEGREKEDNTQAGVSYSSSKKNVGKCDGGFDNIGLKERKWKKRRKIFSEKKIIIKGVNGKDDSDQAKGSSLKTVVEHSTSVKQTEVCGNKANDDENLVIRSPEASELVCSNEKCSEAEKPGHVAVDSSQKSGKTEPVLPLDGFGSVSVEIEGASLDVMGRNQEVLEGQTNDFSKLNALAVEANNAAVELSNTEVAKDVDTTVLPIPENCASETLSGEIIDNTKEVTRSLPSKIDVVMESDGLNHCTEQECEAVVTSSTEDQDKVKTLEEASGSQLEKDEKTTENQRDNKFECEGAKNSIEVHRISAGSEEVTRCSSKTSNLSGEDLPSPASHQKTKSVGNSSSLARSSLADNNRAGSSQCPCLIDKRVSSSASTKKESGRVDKPKHEKSEKSKGILKILLKASSKTMLKTSQSCKTVTSPTHKHDLSLGKDSTRHSSSKKSAVESVEPAGSQQTQHASTGQNKDAGAAGKNRGDKAHQSKQSSSTSTQSSLRNPQPLSSAPAGLSDEEFALLLHQELNSSTRIPRVPRLRHASSLPQLSSASETTLFIKRSNSSGEKVQLTYSRRKNKDGSRSSHERESEARKVDKAVDSQTDSTHSVRKNTEDISTTSAYTGPSSTDPNKQKSSSTRDSLANNPEDVTGTNKNLAPTHRTLPGLIAEIMGEGRRMTYEELCNLVLPHWKNLRKHNGKKYAYSSHSQAVLDCLRKHSKWACLVDRAPKNNASRKKRKIDIESLNESEDGEDDKPRKIAKLEP